MNHQVTPNGLVIAQNYSEDADYFYWTDGKKVFRGVGEVKDADVETFEPLLDEFARDKNYCYLQGRKLKDADAHTFRSLSFTYAADNKHVWTLVGVIPEADIETFRALDSGKHSLGLVKYELPDGTFRLVERFVPHGFAKDKNHVYYYDYEGKTKILKTADAATFVSHDDGYFGHDHRHVFCGFSKVPKANPATWQKFEGSVFYARDGQKVFYGNAIVEGADAETFEPVIRHSVIGNPSLIPLAKDKNNYYHAEMLVSLQEFEKYMKMLTDAKFS